MKILYGLPSEGMGHATRSKVIIQYLLQQHDVQIVTSDKAYTFLAVHFPNRVHQIDGFHLAYRQAEISVGKTLLWNLTNAPKSLINNTKQYFQSIKDFNPDLVISDFESFTYFYAKLHRKPLISIDNMQVIDRSKLQIDIPNEERLNYKLAKNIIKAKVVRANHYLITTFFHPPIQKKYTTYIPPIIRDEIVGAIISIQNHIVIYQSSTPQKILLPILHHFSKEEFIVYGFNQTKQIKNVTLKAFSEQEFSNDFTSAKAVMANGGFSFLSEAVYLHKPIFTVPIPNQFEQFVNSSYVQKLGYGMQATSFNVESINIFFNDLASFQIKLNTYQQEGNQIAFIKLNEILANYGPPKKTRLA